ncbi:MAG: CorA family divalent cation transporter [Gammaproteobacteria bacterium]
MDLTLSRRPYDEDARGHGLVYGFLIGPDGRIVELSWSELDTVFAEPQGCTWFHFDAAKRHAREWIQGCERLPLALREFLLDFNQRHRLETVGEAVIGAISDVQYRFDFDPDHIATLRFYVDPGCLISTRLQPLSAPDQLRRAIRERWPFDSTAMLMTNLFRLQTETLVNVNTCVSEELGEVEDQILAHRIEDQRGQLGKIRRLTARLHRHFAPEHRALHALAQRLPPWFNDRDRAVFLDTVEDLGLALHDLDAIQERAKLLQKELAGRVAEEINHSLFRLSVVMTVFLPMTLITGIFGMNVGGLPGLEDQSAFLWVMLTMIHLKAFPGKRSSAVFSVAREPANHFPA